MSILTLVHTSPGHLLRHMRAEVTLGDRHRCDVSSAGGVAAARALRLRAQHRRRWVAVLRHVPNLLPRPHLALRRRRRQPWPMLPRQHR
jgi:hypothetical protein